MNDIAFAATRPLLLSANESGTARFWNSVAIKPIFADVKNDSRETLVGRYSRDGSKFLAGGKDGMANLYRVDESGRLQHVCGVKHRKRRRSLRDASHKDRETHQFRSPRPPPSIAMRKSG